MEHLWQKKEATGTGVGLLEDFQLGVIAGKDAHPHGWMASTLLSSPRTLECGPTVAVTQDGVAP